LKEISLNILDVTENSVKAGSSLTEIKIIETAEELTLFIIDNGCGMDEEILKSVTDPFYTTRTTRKVGLGVPLLKLAAEQTGGSFEIASSVDSNNHGTTVKALFYKNHIDFTPLGDIVSTILTLIQGHPDTDFLFTHEKENTKVVLDTREIKNVLGEDVPINSYDVIKWLEEYLKEQYNSNLD